MNKKVRHSNSKQRSTSMLLTNAAAEVLARLNPQELSDGIRVQHLIELLKAEQGSANFELSMRLSSDAKLAKLSGWLSNPRGGGLVEQGRLQKFLVSQTIHEKNVYPVMRRIAKTAKNLSSEISDVSVFVGLKLSSRIRISDRIELVPWNLVGDSIEKGAFDSSENSANARRMERVNPMRLEPEFVAIIKSTATARIHPNAHTENYLEGMRQAQQSIQLSSDVGRCCAILAENLVYELGNWQIIHDDFFRTISGACYSYPSNSKNLRILEAAFKAKELDSRRIRKVIVRFGKFKDLPALRRAVDRFRNSYEKFPVIDQVIDLGIALEILLLHGAGDKSELSFRFALRGAVFLETNSASKKQTFKLLRSFYSLRSKAVHVGFFDEQTEVEAVTAIAQVQPLFCRLAFKLVEYGRFPDWEAEFILK